MPPRRKPSELRQALDAAKGNWPAPDDAEPMRRESRLRGSKVRASARQALPWLGDLTTQILAAVIAALIVILLLYLF